MSDIARVVCKFQCQGVENTQSFVSRKVYKDVEPDLFDSLTSAYTYADGGRPYKYAPYDPPKHVQNIRLVTQYDTSNPEDVSFAASTPSGEMKFMCDNPNVIGWFEPGKKYKIYIEPCD